MSKHRLTATYKNLLGVFISASHDAGARAVCEVLQNKGIVIANTKQASGLCSHAGTKLKPLRRVSLSIRANMHPQAYL